MKTLFWLLSAVLAVSAQPLTQPVQAQAPEGTEGGPAPPGLHRWYVNSDRTIWMFAEPPLIAKKTTKVAWFRPAATDLKVSGRRLDGSAGPLTIEVGTGSEYRHRFTPSLMTFPSAGRWEILARVGSSEARFVVQVK